MTVKELADMLKDLPDQDCEVAIAFDHDVRMPVNVVTTHTTREWDYSSRTPVRLVVLTSTDEIASKDKWS